MDSDKTQITSKEVDLSDFLRIRNENFQRLMWSRASIREDFEHRIKMLERERDAELEKNYALLQQLGMPEELMPLPPENEEIKKSRLDKGDPRKLNDTEIKRVLREMMRPKKLYTASQLIGFMQVTYKDFSQFYQKYSHTNDAKNPPFLYGEGDLRWRRYRLWEPRDSQQ